jgi:hypothetical protein
MKTEIALKRFSFERAALLLRNRTLDDLPAVAVAAGVLVALNVLSLVSGSAPFMNAAGPGTAWPAAVFIGGILLAGRAFERMQDGRSGPDWLLLPATSEEKYLSALGMYLAVYPVAASLAAWSISAGSAFLGNLFGVGGGKVWMPLRDIGWTGVSAYLSCAIVAIAGSARFRKFAIGKTAGVAFAWLAVLALGFGLTLTLVTSEWKSIVNFGSKMQLNINDGPAGMTINGVALPPATESTLRLVMDLFRWISVAFAAIYGFALVKEKEARDEVQ